jgi:hypothetical protein
MTQYEFRLSLRSNDPKVVFTGKYLSQFDDMRHRILSGMVKSEYPIALCLDPTKTDDEVLLATIESISNDLAQAAYKANFIKASRGINITPDMLSNFGHLPSIQYASGESVDRVSQDEDREVLAASIPSSILASSSGSTNAESPVISIDETPIEEEEDEDYDPYENMTDEEYKIAMAGVIERPVMKS